STLVKQETSVSRQLDILEQLIQFGLVPALHSFGYHIAIQVRREFFDKVAHEAAHEGAAAKADLGHAGLEQLTGVEHDQIRIQLLVHGHFHHDADTQPQ